jgi:hypothetical protein
MAFVLFFLQMNTEEVEQYETVEAYNVFYMQARALSHVSSAVLLIHSS